MPTRVFTFLNNALVVPSDTTMSLSVAVDSCETESATIVVELRVEHITLRHEVRFTTSTLAQALKMSTDVKIGSMIEICTRLRPLFASYLAEEPLDAEVAGQLLGHLIETGTVTRTDVFAAFTEALVGKSKFGTD